MSDTEIYEMDEYGAKQETEESENNIVCEVPFFWGLDGTEKVGMGVQMNIVFIIGNKGVKLEILNTSNSDAPELITSFLGSVKSMPSLEIFTDIITEAVSLAVGKTVQNYHARFQELKQKSEIDIEAKGEN